jgi:hypothetical protein
MVRWFTATMRSRDDHLRRIDDAHYIELSSAVAYSREKVLDHGARIMCTGTGSVLHQRQPLSNYTAKECLDAKVMHRRWNST